MLQNLSALPDVEPKPTQQLFGVLALHRRRVVHSGAVVREQKTGIEDFNVFAEWQSGYLQGNLDPSLFKMGQGGRLCDIPHHAAGNARRTQELFPESGRTQ